MRQPRYRAAGISNDRQAAPQRKGRGARSLPAEDKAQPAPSGAVAARGDFSQGAFERFASILGSSQMSQPMYARRRADLMQRLQRDYGNRYVQGLVSRIQRKRASETAESKQKEQAGSAAFSASSMTGRAAAPIQRYEDFTDSDGNYRIGDNAGMAVKEESAEGGQEVWATEALMGQANKKLLSEKSAIVLVKGGGSWGMDGNKWVDIHPQIRDLSVSSDTDAEKLKAANRSGAAQTQDSEGVKDETLALWTDCGEASRTVTGGMVAATYKKGSISAKSRVSTDPEVFSNTMYKNVVVPFMESDVSTPFLKEGVHYKVDDKDPNLWLLLAPADSGQARKMYWSLGEKGRDAFDKFAGINKYANPEVGQTYTIVSESKMPGYKEKGFTWNFHWAGVIMKDGPDNMTLEGYAVMAGDEEIEELKRNYSGAELDKKLEELEDKYASWINRSWVVQMYGTKKAGQTFHEQHLGSGTHGTRATTMAAKKK